MKKIVLSSIVLIIIFVAFFMLLRSNSSNGEEGLENSLVKSMDESKVAKEKLEQFITKSHQELNKSGYEVGLSYSDQKILTIQVQDKAFLEANKTNIEKIIYSTAKEIGFQDFKVDFLTSDSYPTITEENQKFSESMMTAYEEISSLLQKNEYEYHSMSISPNNDIIIEIKSTDIGNKEIEEPISKKIEEIIAQKIPYKLNANIEVKFQKISKSTLQDQEWQPIFDAIRVETEKKFEEYKGFAYSFHPEPLQIIIKTELDTPKWFRNSNRKANQIKKYVQKIIDLKREELSIKEIPYEIIVRDKNSKKIK